LVDGGKNEGGVLGSVIFDGNGGTRKQTSRYLLRNKISKIEDEDGGHPA
jgi:hypothetical protein